MDLVIYMSFSVTSVILRLPWHCNCW